MAGAKSRTKKVAANRVIAPEAWTPELLDAWAAAQHLVARSVALSHPRAGHAILMFPDASDEHWGSFLTQVPQDELDRA